MIENTIEAPEAHSKSDIRPLTPELLAFIDGLCLELDLQCTKNFRLGR